MQLVGQISGREKKEIDAGSGNFKIVNGDMEKTDTNVGSSEKSGFECEFGSWSL